MIVFKSVWRGSSGWEQKIKKKEMAGPANFDKSTFKTANRY